MVLSPTLPLLALLYMWGAKDLSLPLTITSCTLLWLLKPPADFITELTQITCRLLRKDLCKIVPYLFAVMKSHVNSKSSFRHADPTVDITKIFSFLSLRVFSVLSSSLLLFPQRFGRYVHRPSSGVCRIREPSWNFELRPLLNPRASPVLIPFAIAYKC